MSNLYERRLRQTEIFDRTARNNDSRSGGHLVRKQVSDQRYWLDIWETIGDRVTRAHVDQLIQAAARDVQSMYRGRAVAYGWSGGKDSLALEIVMDAAGITECVFVITDLEYPEFLKWATDRMPDGCEVVYRADVNLNWLTRQPDMLFPPDSQASSKWFAAVQHAGQADYNHRRGIELMHLGRRSLDGNMTGKDGFTSSRRGNFYNPIRHWTHEDVLAVLHYHEIELPPIYRWPRGFQVGTGPWPARQFCRTVEDGWREVWEIDQTIVRQAVPYLPSAADFMRNRE